MTDYVLRDDISYCQIGGRLVFLDIDKDRYFHLPHRLEQAFTMYLGGAHCPAQELGELSQRSILVERERATPEDRPSIEPAARSAMESTGQPRNLRVSELVEVLVTVLITRLALKFSALKTILDGLAAARHARTTKSEPREALQERNIREASAAFRRARLYVPIDMRCLLDSIAMVRFLLRRQIPARVVFGVALDPFSAHCWVQVDDLVLNDSVGNVASHTPIRVV